MEPLDELSDAAALDDPDELSEEPPDPFEEPSAELLEEEPSAPPPALPSADAVVLRLSVR